MRITPRRALALLIGAVPLFVACTSSTNGGATSTTLAVPSSVLTQSTLPDTSSTVTVVTTAPPVTTLPVTTVAPTSTAPDGASVTITRGGFITKTHGSCNPTNCKYVEITSSGWTPREPLSVTCYSSTGSSGPYSKFADSSGNFNSSTVCFFGNATGVYVAINGSNSNVVTHWKDW